MNDSYFEGREAAFRGEPHWMNPHAEELGVKENFHQWYAGWCDGMRTLG